MINHYIQSFLHSVKKNNFFYSINLLGFFVGFLLLTIISAFVYQELSFDRFHKQASSIYRIHSGGYGVTPLCFKEKLKEKLPELVHVVQLSSTGLTLGYDEKTAEVKKAYFADPELFRLFSFRLLSGDPEKVLKAPFSIVLDKSTAYYLFGDQIPLGKIIHGEKGEYTVTGIMEDIPYNSHLRSQAFVSMETLKSTEDEVAFNCGSWSSLTYVSLSKESDVKETEIKINVLLKDCRMAGNSLKLEPLKKIYFDYSNNKYDGCRHGNLQTTFLYLAIAILILVIVIINYINLFTMILTARLKEFSVRRINGAEKKQIIKQVLVETIGVTFFSSVISLVVVELLLSPLSSVLNIPVNVSFNRFLLYACYFSCIGVIGCIMGFIPGLFISKTNAVKVLKNESIFGRREIRRKLFLLFQLLIVATLLNLSFIIKNQINFLLKKDMGFCYENVITFRLDETLQEKQELLKDKLYKIPSVEIVSCSNGLMGEGFTKVPIDNSENHDLCYTYTIDPEYLKLYAIDLKYGRNFSPDLKSDNKNSCIINEEACITIGIEDPIDRMINGRRIVGVVKNFNYSSLHNVIEPLLICCGTGKVIQIKIAPDNQNKTIDNIRSSCISISPDFEFDYAFLDTQIKELYKSDLNVRNSIGAYSIVAFLIALLGLLGLMLFIIRKKIKEVNIRKLHGASVSDILKLFLKEQLRIILISNAIAIPVSVFIVNKWLENFSYRVDIGFLVFLKTLIVTLIFNVLVISVLVVKAQKTNVVEALKNE